MAVARSSFPFDVLVDLMAEHDSQSTDGSPVSRVEDRLRRSVKLAERAGLVVDTIRLDGKDFGWLCNARGIDRLSNSASLLTLDGFRVHRGHRELESHICGQFAGRLDQAFPIIQDPTRTPGFVQYIASASEKAAMEDNLRRSAHLAAFNTIDVPATMH